MRRGVRLAGRILAVDPGRGKCGLAVLEADGWVVERSVLGATELAERVRQVLSGSIREVVLGSGTGSKGLAATLQPICEAAGVPLVTVEEAYSTELARLLYFQENPPRGWRRLIPVSFQTPPRPCDDYGAVVIGRRRLEGAQTGHEVDGKNKERYHLRAMSAKHEHRLKAGRR